MKIKFLKKYQFKRFTFKKGQVVDIYKTEAVNLIAEKVAVPEGVAPKSTKTIKDGTNNNTP